MKVIIHGEVFHKRDQERLEAICYIFNYTVHRHSDHCLEVFHKGHFHRQGATLPLALARHFLEVTGIIRRAITIELNPNNDDVIHGDWNTLNTATAAAASAAAF